MGIKLYWETNDVGIWTYRICNFDKDFFLEKSVKDILVPGIGYGRNAKVFIENGINVTGIEISKRAIDLAKQNGLEDVRMYHGSVNEMPFDNKLYDGIFSHALFHLLNEQERENFIKDCYNQLKPGGYLIFTTVSKKAPCTEKETSWIKTIMR